MGRFNDFLTTADLSGTGFVQFFLAKRDPHHVSYEDTREKTALERNALLLFRQTGDVISILPHGLAGARVSAM